MERKSEYSQMSEPDKSRKDLPKGMLWIRYQAILQHLANGASE